MVLPQDDPSYRLLTERTASNTYLPISDLGGTYLRQDTAAATYAPAASVGSLVTAALATDPTPANAAAAAVNTALAAANQAFTLVWGRTKTTGPATVSRGTPVYGTPAKFGGTALRGALLTASGVAPEPVGTSVTVEGWVYAAAPAAGSNPMVAWSHGANLWFGALGTTGYAVISISGDTPSRVNTTVNICDGAWHHIAYEVTRVNGITYLKGFWIDGQVIGLNSPSIAKTWSANLDIGGLFSSSIYDWPGSLDEIRLSVGSRYKAAFTPATSEGVVEGRTLLLAHMTSATMDVAVRSYPARPASAPGGSVRYFGPFQPTDWLTDDKWEVML